MPKLREKIVSLHAIIFIGAIELYALHKGIDGVGLNLSLTAIAALGGWAASKKAKDDVNK